MSLMRSRFALAALAVAILVTTLASLPRAPGQDVKEPPTSPPASRARPIPAVDFHIPWMGFRIFAMNAESNKPVLGRPTVPPSDLRYFYLPLLAFQKSGTGELDVTASDAGEVTLPLIYDSEEARQAVRDYLVKEKLIPADSMSGQVMTVAAKMWRLETAPGYEPRVTFGPYENFQFGMKGQLHTRLAPDKAAKFVDDLKAGNVELQATIVFDGYTYLENTVVVYADDLLNSDQYKKLTGPGGKGFVGRHQVARIAREACLTRGVAVTTEYDDPDFNDLVKNLVANFAQKESKPVADWDAVEKFFKDAGWDPNDFKADLITSAKMSQNKEIHDTFSQEIEKASTSKGSGGVNIFDIVSIGGSGEGTDSEKSKVCRDVLDKWSINTEWTGKKSVPKSIDVYTLNAASIRQTSAFAVGKRKKTVSDGILTVAINPNDNVLHTKATPAYEERLAKLLGQVADLEKISISKTRVDIRGSKTCMAPRLDPQGYYEFPVFLNFAAAAAAPTLLDQPYQEDGRERVFGQEIVAVFLIPQRLHADNLKFDDIQAFKKGDNKVTIHVVDTQGDGWFVGDLLVIYRDK